MGKLAQGEHNGNENGLRVAQNLTAGQLNAIVKKLGGEEGALKFLRGELVVQPVVISEPPPEPVLNFLVRVDRSVKPSYPDWMKKLMHPELELAGPAEYNLQDGVEQWLHDGQKNGVVSGNTIYKHLQKGDNLATCLNLQDGRHPSQGHRRVPQAVCGQGSVPVGLGRAGLRRQPACPVSP